MTGRYEGPPGGEDDVAVSARWHDGPPSGIRVFRAFLVIAVVVVLGVLLLPSAARAPKTSTATPVTRATSHRHSTTTTLPPTTTTTQASVPASSIAVLVANGTDTAHGAGEVRTYLGGKGFKVSGFPAYDTTTPESADAVYAVGNGTAEMATEVARALALGTSVVRVGAHPPVQTTTGADVVVVLGTDLATRADAGTLDKPPSSSTTTTTTTTS